MKTQIARRVHFSSGHRYYQPLWDENKNRAEFGSCYSEHGHGHNYMLDAYFEGEIDPQSGMTMNLMDIDKILKQVTDPLDHQHLNFDIEEFKTLVPTTENIAKYCFEKTKALTPAHIRLAKIRLYEGDDLWVDYIAEEPT